MVLQDKKQAIPGLAEYQLAGGVGYVTFTLTGRTPVLQSNPAMMQRPTDRPTRKAAIPSAEEEAEQRCYRNADGHLQIKAIAVRNSILSGAKGMRYGKRAARPFLAGAMLPAEEMFTFYRGGLPIQTYSIDVRRAVIQRQGILRARPMIDLPWELLCRFEFNGGVSAPQIHAAGVEAGRIVGIGDYRPEKDGYFGMFIMGDVVISS